MNRLKGERIEMEINEEAKKCKKVFILHSSVIKYDPNSIKVLADKDNLVVIHISVIEELGNYEMADEAIRMIDSFRGDGMPVLSKGVRVGPEKGFVLIDSETVNAGKYWPNLKNSVDNMILAEARKWMRNKDFSSKDIIVITRDPALRLKADSVGIKVEDYNKDRSGELYLGYSEIRVAIEDLGTQNQFFHQKCLPLEMLAKSVDTGKLLPNQCLKFIYGEAENDYILAIYKRKSKCFRFVERPKDFKEQSTKGDIYPRNDLQALFYALLKDRGISLVMGGGRAGTGKSLMTFRAGYEQLGNTYKTLMIFKPIIEVGQKSLGYLPGDMEEKMCPWEDAIHDNLRLIIENKEGKYLKRIKGGKKEECEEKPNESYKKFIEDLKERNLLEIKPVSYIRGRSLNNSFVIVDEVQNLTPSEVKTVTSRPGENTKVVLIGDVGQIDNRDVDEKSNGLTVAIKKLIDDEETACLTLTQGERSKLAELVASRM